MLVVKTYTEKPNIVKQITMSRRFYGVFTNTNRLYDIEKS